MNTPQYMESNSPLSQDQVEHITLAICSQYPKGKLLLGSQLGSIISGFIKPYKASDFNGLRPLVDRYLSDVVVWAGQTQGTPPDDYYRVTAQSSGWVDALSTQGRDLWDNFSNPNKSARFTLNVSESKIFFTIDENTKADEDFQAISKPSPADYKIAATEYTKILPEHVQAEATHILQTGDSFFKRWFKFIEGIERKADWEKARIKFVLKFAENQLASLQCHEDLIGSFSFALGKSQRYRTKEDVSINTQSFVAEARSIESNADIYTLDQARLRSAVKLALDKMSDQEVRSLSIPAGLLFDGLNAVK